MGLPEFIVIGADDHPLGKRSFWLYEDGSAEMVSEAYGLVSTATFGPSEGRPEVEKVRAAYADHDKVRG